MVCDGELIKALEKAFEQEKGLRQGAKPQNGEPGEDTDDERRRLRRRRRIRLTAAKLGRSRDGLTSSTRLPQATSPTFIYAEPSCGSEAFSPSEDPKSVQALERQACERIAWCER
jgi:hypothetical protein